MTGSLYHKSSFKDIVCDNAYWMTFDVINTTSSEAEWLFKFAYPT
jgi:hypothetical protein